MKKAILKYFKYTTLIAAALWLSIIYIAFTPYKVNTYKLTNNDKTIIFQEMVHVGDKEYYEKINQKILDYKKQGFKLYYELIVIKSDNDLNEMRKKIGIDSNIFAELINQTQLDTQQNNMLKIEDADVHADINSDDLIKRLDTHFTTNIKPELPFSLDSLLFNTTEEKSDWSKPISRGFLRLGLKINDILRLDPTNANDVIISQRNDVLINIINKNNDKNIFVQYGAFHFDDFKNKMTEQGWKTEKIDKIEVF